MKISAISDQHGHLSHSTPPSSVLAIAGDFVPMYSSAEFWQTKRELDWIERKYLRWLHRQEFDKCLIVPGNHDLCLWDKETKQLAIDMLESVPGVKVLADHTEIYHFKNVSFSGYPWTPTIQNRNWAYSLPRSSEGAKIAASEIPAGIDILISHGPPQGFVDRCRDGDRVGCANLMHRMLEVGPRLTICGHIHEARGFRTKWFDRDGRLNTIMNVSVCDENYSVSGAKVQTYLFV